jgi:MYXO-CTERM domain-containing protein
MKSTILLVGVAAFFAANSPANTVSFDYSNFTGATGLTFPPAGNVATISGADLELTSGVVSGGKAGMAYYANPLTLQSDDYFTTTFEFQLTSPQNGGGNGFAFVISAPQPSLGGNGEDLGYDVLGNPSLINPDSLAVAFNTYGNDGHPGNNFVSIDTDGYLSVTDPNNVDGIATCSSGVGCMMNGDIWTATITYDGTDLAVSLYDGSNGPYTTVIAENLASILGGSSTAYVGLSGGTGDATEKEDILNWQVSTAPEPGSWMLLGLGLLLGAGLHRYVAARRQKQV